MSKGNFTGPTQLRTDSERIEHLQKIFQRSGSDLWLYNDLFLPLCKNYHRSNDNIRLALDAVIDGCSLEPKPMKKSFWRSIFDSKRPCEPHTIPNPEDSK